MIVSYFLRKHIFSEKLIIGFGNITLSFEDKIFPRKFIICFENMIFNDYSPPNKYLLRKCDLFVPKYNLFKES